MSLFSELRRRNVFRVAIAYVVVAWLILQVSEILVPALRLPDWVLTATLYFLIIGFLPALVFAWAFELTPEGLRKEKDVDRATSITHITGRKLDFAIIALLAIAVAYFTVDKFMLRGGADSRDVAGEKSIAVLPFANMSEDAANEFFSDGISEEILNALAQIDELRVAGRTSSFAFKGRNEDLRLIGETLNVSHILEGSVRKAGDTVRVTAQLISVDDGYHLWSQTWDRELDDIFAIQDEIAAAILEELKAELVGEDRVAAVRTDPRAYERYLQARQLMYTRTEPALEQAAELLDEALELDPGFAPAWAQRGILAMLLSNTQYGTLPFADAQLQAKMFLERALELDEGLAEGWAGLGLYFSKERGPENSATARAHLEHALAINPSMIDASNWLYGVYRDEYRSRAATALLEDMFERDPLYPPLLGNMQLSYMTLDQEHRFDEVLNQVRPFLHDRANFEMAQAQQKSARGDHAGALAIAEAAYAKAPNNSFVAGTLQRALTFLGEIERAVDVSRSTPNWTAPLLVYLGREEEALILARNWFEATGFIEPLMQTMSLDGRHEALTRLVEDRWSTIEGFRNQYPPTMGFGDPLMLYLAHAYHQTGREESFREAMRLAREDHDRQIEAGIGWSIFWLREAHYWTLAGDHERAIDFLAKAVDDHFRLSPRISRMFPVLKPLEGDPRFEAVQQRMLKEMNRDRANAGLEPLEPAYSL